MAAVSELSQAAYAIIAQMEVDLQQFRDGGMTIHRGGDDITLEVVEQVAVNLAELRRVIRELAEANSQQE